MHNAPAAAATLAIATLATAPRTTTRAAAYALRSNMRRKAYNLRRLRSAARRYYAAQAVRTVVAHSMAQFAAAQRYGFNW